MNPTKAELCGYVDRLLKPLLQIFAQDIEKPQESLWLQGHAAHYPDDAIRCEAFSRTLWGLAPAVAGGHDIADKERWLALCAELFRQGTDPSSPYYWGESLPHRPDQRHVEMCAMAYAFLLAPEAFWQVLSEQTQQNVFTWMKQINHSDGMVADNNWRFFRIFVNSFFKKYGGPFHQERYTADFRALESMYVASGWYSDGHSEQYDYYIPMAMHYYGLLHSYLIEQNPVYIERAQTFAPDFLSWFDASGAALPYGRSLTYRFAQASFWSGYILSGSSENQALGLGTAKGLLMRHLRAWFEQAIWLPTAGDAALLSVGYSYPNLQMSEGYNAPGSPYWGQKIFAVMALPPSHPFWGAAEEPLPEHLEQRVQPQARMLFQRSRSGETKALCGGQWARFEPNHVHEKYAKFSYAPIFGFHLATHNEAFANQSFDSMISFSREGRFWAHRGRTTAQQINECGVCSSCEPLPGVQLRTLLYPVTLLGDNFAWHLRIHRITTDCDIHFVEGAYALPYNYSHSLQLETVDEGPAWIAAGSVHGQMPLFSALRGLNYQASPMLLQAAPNTNIVVARSAIPLLKGNLAKGEHLLASLCGGGPLAHEAASLAAKRGQSLSFQLQGERILLSYPKQGDSEPLQNEIHLRDWGLLGSNSL